MSSYINERSVSTALRNFNMFKEWDAVPDTQMAQAAAAMALGVERILADDRAESGLRPEEVPEAPELASLILKLTNPTGEI